MISKEAFNRELGQLGLIYEKQIPKELAQITYDRLSGILENDNQLQTLFGKLSEETYFPRLGKMVAVARELGFKKAGQNLFSRPIHFQCRCEKIFAIVPGHLDRPDTVDCPNVMYEACNRSYETSYLKKMFSENCNQSLIPLP